MMRCKHGVGVFPPEQKSLINILAPCKGIAGLSTAYRIEVMHSMCAIFGHTEKILFREKEIHF